jgi:predicted TIM-barrel fold metal-dependent hydrolase
MIVDFHTHVFPPQIKSNRDKYVGKDPFFASLYSNPKAALTTTDDLISAMDEQGVNVSVIQNIQWSTLELCAETNDYILESIARYPGRLTGLVVVNLENPDEALKEIERCAKGGAKGIGEMRPADAVLKAADRLRPVADYLAEKGMILSTHTSEPIGHAYPGKGELTPTALLPFIQAFASLPVVCAHWGGGLPFYALMPEVRKALQNVYFDSAASPYLYQSKVYSVVAGLVGEDKILFGSDFPLLPPRRLLAQIESENLPYETKRRLLSENACRLLRLK